MSDSGSWKKKYLLTFAFGAVAGGILISYVTRAMPKIMSRMMRNMMAEMGGEGCSPSEI
jgi:hypothetical protein